MGTFRFIEAMHTEAFSTATPEVIETIGFNMLTAELEAFAASIEAGRPFPTPLADIRHGVAVFEAILRSVASGEPEMID
jgi:predicted dehydrogenase